MIQLIEQTPPASPAGGAAAPPAAPPSPGMGGGIGGMGGGLGGGMPPPSLGGGGGLGAGLGGGPSPGAGGQPVEKREIDVVDIWDVLKKISERIDKYPELKLGKKEEKKDIKQEKKRNSLMS